MKLSKHSIIKVLLGVLCASLFAVGSAYGQTLQPNQTMGFSNGKLVKFTYLQNYDCVDQPTNDLDYNGMAAQSDAGEFQTPICQAGLQTTIDPTGKRGTNFPILYVLVPMFSVNNDQNPEDAIACPPGVRLGTLCGPALGKTLIQLFGAVPEAYKAKPAVFTDCPNPGALPGTCTMHASTVDLGLVLTALGKLPPPVKNVFLPTPNHSHVIADARAMSRPIWWEVKPVLVPDIADWPPADGSSGITSVASLDRAEAKGDAIEVPSNFFLFFSSQKMHAMHGGR